MGREIVALDIDFSLPAENCEIQAVVSEWSSHWKFGVGPDPGAEKDILDNDF